jgi:hypothetical protein
VGHFDLNDVDRISRAYQQAHVILLRLGLVLVGLFALDLVEAAIAVAHHQGASADFSPLIAGIVLIRGGLRPVRTVRFLAGLAMTGGFIGMIVRVWAPIQLITTELRLHDFERLIAFGAGCIYALVAIAVYRGACSESVEIALRAEFGEPNWTSNPVLGPLAGVLVSIAFYALSVSSRPTFDVALAAANAKYGHSYQYAVTGWQAYNQDQKVDIDAYNTEAIKKIEVDVVYGHVKNITNVP